MITTKEMLLGAYERTAKKVANGNTVGGIDADFLIIMLDNKVMNGDFLQEEIQPIVDILVSPTAEDS